MNVRQQRNVRRGDTPHYGVSRVKRELFFRDGDFPDVATVLRGAYQYRSYGKQGSLLGGERRRGGNRR